MTTVDKNMRLSPNFTLRELTYSFNAKRAGIDNTPPADKVPRLVTQCTKVLEPVRDHYGRPVTVNSCWRGKMLNSITPGASNTSDHAQANATDFEIKPWTAPDGTEYPGVSNLELAHWCKDNLESWDQIILEYWDPEDGDPNDGWVHVGYRTPETNRHQVLWARKVKQSDGTMKTEYFDLPPLPDSSDENPMRTTNPLPGVRW